MQPMIDRLSPSDSNRYSIMKSQPIPITSIYHARGHTGIEINTSPLARAISRNAKGIHITFVSLFGLVNVKVSFYRWT